MSGHTFVDVICEIKRHLRRRNGGICQVDLGLLPSAYRFPPFPGNAIAQKLEWYAKVGALFAEHRISVGALDYSLNTLTLGPGPDFDWRG